MDYSCLSNLLQRGSYARKFFRAETITPSAAEAPLSAERMRPTLSSPASAPTVLQRRVSGGGAATIRSLAYFLPVIEEVRELPFSQDYFQYLRHKLQRIAPTR